MKYPPAPKADTDIIAAAQAKFVKTKNRLLYERETEGARKRIAALAAAYEKIAQQDEADRQLTLKETIDVLVGKGWTVKEVMSSATGKGSFQEQKNERYICPPGP